MSMKVQISAIYYLCYFKQYQISTIGTLRLHFNQPEVSKFEVSITLNVRIWCKSSFVFGKNTYAVERKQVVQRYINFLVRHWYDISEPNVIVWYVPANTSFQYSFTKFTWRNSIPRCLHIASPSDASLSANGNQG